VGITNMSWIDELINLKERFPFHDCHLYSDSIEFEEMIKNRDGDIYFHCEQMEGDIHEYETVIVPKLKEEIEELDIECGRIVHLKEYGDELEMEIRKLRSEIKTYEDIVSDIGGVYLDEVSLRWNVNQDK